MQTQLTVGLVQTQTTMRHHLTPVRTASKTQEMTRLGKDVEKICCWWECKFVQPLWKKSVGFPQKIKNRTTMVLSRFSRVRLCVTPEMAAHQAPSSLGFSKQEHWSGLPRPSPMQESESEVAQSCPTLSDPMDCSLPGSFIHGIFQARVREWGAIDFSSLTI